MTAEDKIHVALLAAIATASASLFAVERPLSTPPPVEARARVAAPPGDVRREELDAAISLLRDWIQDRYSRSDDPRELGLAVCALGRAALGPEPQQRLGRLIRAWPRELTTRAASLVPVSGAPLAAPGPESPLGEAAPMAVLATLLEAGLPLEQRVPLEAGETTLGALVRAALEASPELSSNDVAGRLDLTAFAALAGMRDESAKLGQLTYESLKRLELGYREWNTARVDGGLDAASVDELGKSFREGGELEPGAAELHASAAVFRAVAVLAERDLDEPARRHLGALSYRYRIERALYGHLLAEADGAKARARVHLTAVERLGRLEQALYQAHLLYRTEHQPQPTAELARLMRQVARDLLDHLAQARGSVLSDTPANAAQREPALRAAVHALRGLRTARIAL